jgi:hypothetical protein
VAAYLSEVISSQSGAERRTAPAWRHTHFVWPHLRPVRGNWGFPLHGVATDRGSVCVCVQVLVTWHQPTDFV